MESLGQRARCYHNSSSFRVHRSGCPALGGLALQESHLEKIRKLFHELGDEDNDVITYAMPLGRVGQPETPKQSCSVVCCLICWPLGS